MSHKITLNEAVKLLHAYIYLSPFEPIKNNLPIGGHIYLNNLNGKPERASEPEDLLVRGTRCWYICANSAEGRGEDVSLADSMCFSVAFESTKIQDTNNPERGAKSSKLYSCKKESMIDADPSISVNQFLLNFTGSQPSQQEFTSSEVDVMTRNFARKFPCNPTSVAFFINDDGDFAINDFLRNEGLSSARFFYGYDPRLERDNIRLILIGVDENSHNIIGENSVILERSWPPK